MQRIENIAHFDCLQEITRKIVERTFLLSQGNQPKKNLDIELSHLNFSQKLMNH